MKMTRIKAKHRGLERDYTAMSKFKKRMLVCISLLIVLTYTLSIAVYADDSRTRSIVGDFFNKVFDIELNNGKGLLETHEDIVERGLLNEEIKSGTTKVYSLYDRFGGSVRFVPYFGETKISTNLLDRFYTKIMDNVDDFSLSLSDIKKFFASPAISNNVIYNDRPNILSSDSIEAGSYDPRVAAYSGISSAGGDASVGNLFLAISNTFTQITGYLSGGGMFNTINDLFTEICDNGFADVLQGIVKFLLPIAIIVFVFRLVMNAFAVSKGTFSFKRFILQLSSSLISLGLIFSLMSQPAKLSGVINQVVTLFDNILDQALNITEDEIIHSDNPKNVRIATLWKHTVLEPWCEGTFGNKYENLYTQLDSDPDHVKMPQDNDDVLNVWSDGSVRYNSVQLTGDAKVPIGAKDVRNWAALAWSCQSIYHIDAVENGSKTGVSLEDGIWPEAMVTPMNSNIYVDNFRWVDAMLNISPEYHSPEDIIQSYTNARAYNESFRSSGSNSLWVAFLLLPILILSIKKTKEAVIIVFASVRLINHSAMNFILPNDYDVLSNLKKIVSKVYDYIWWSLIVFLAINLYDVLMDRGFVVDLLWLFLGLYLNKFKPIRSTKRMMEIKNAVKRKAGRIGEKAKGSFDKLNTKVKNWMK